MAPKKGTKPGNWSGEERISFIMRITPADNQRLIDEAGRRGTSKAELIRQVIKAWFRSLDKQGR
jgi:hypothetical protein